MRDVIISALSAISGTVIINVTSLFERKFSGTRRTAEFAASVREVPARKLGLGPEAASWEIARPVGEPLAIKVGLAYRKASGAKAEAMN